MKRIFLLTFILFHIGLVSQDVISVKLADKEIVTEELSGFTATYYTFEGAVNKFRFGALPLYRTEVPIPDELFEFELNIRSVSFNTVDTNIHNSLTDVDLITNEIQYHIEYYENKATIFVLPFIIDNGSLLNISEFDIHLILVPSAAKNTHDISNTGYTTESILASGKWIKMGITQTGVHKLTYQAISQMGVDPNGIEIENIGIFGNYNGMLPESNSISRLDDLQENTIEAVGLNDGSFDQDDYLLFFAQGPVTWRYNPFTGRYKHENNFYTDTTYYFFTPDKGSLKGITDFEGNHPSPTYEVVSFIDYAVHERDLENMISSGKEWYGERFEADTIEREFVFNFPNIVRNKPVFLSTDIIGRALEDSYYRIFSNDQQVVDSTRIRFISTSLGIFGRKSSSNVTFYSDSDEVRVKIRFESGDANGIGWLDYLVLNAERDLTFTGQQMIFSNPHSAAMGNISEYTVSNTSSTDEIWDITDIHNPVRVIGQYDNGNTIFSIPTDTLKTFIVFDGSEYYTPVSYDEIQNQNLHGITSVNYVIIRPDIFAEQAERLANLHRKNSGLQTVVVDLDEVYNEFSSGSQDISAIRDFMRMLYKRDAFNGERAYLLLFGDASFDYKDRVHNNTNLVPTYEALESLRETGSFVTDDYFGLLDDSEGLNATGNLDIGIGRFPISTTDEAISAVNKIESYMSQDSIVMRDWRSMLCFIADDRDNNLHLTQAEGLASIADTLFEGIRINKIFLDAYNKVTVPGGFRYPDVNKKIDKQMAEGALIINYTGHGGLIGWSDELVLDVPMINAFSNYDNMPLIITATCEFSRFDNPEFTSAGEYTFLNQEGGAIALLTTTRLAYAHANYIVNRRIYYNLLSCDEDGNIPRLGDLVRLSKIPSDENYLNFALLGDPALMLAYPEHKVVTLEERQEDLNVNDTIHALSKVKVRGEIHDNAGSLMSNFNGFLYPKVYDKATNHLTLGNDGNSHPTEFELFDKVIYKGVVSIKNGEFEFEFKVPKDISYQYGYGKINYYAVDSVNYIDAWGGYQKLMLGGIDENAEIDDIGPEIELYLNSTRFKDGDIVTSNPVMLSYIYDESGINNTGNGIGRDMIVIIDNDFANPIKMNEFFKMDIDSYTGGNLVYPFENLTDGIHTLTLRAWDLHNNSSEKTIEFIVDNSADIRLSYVLNSPNPFFDNTEFNFNHNKFGTFLSTTIRIYDIHGNFVTQLESDENNSESIAWDGTNFNNVPVAPGVYTYTVEVKDMVGNITVQQQKLIKLSR